MTTTRREVLGLALVGLLPTMAATTTAPSREHAERLIREHDIAIRLQDNA